MNKVYIGLGTNMGDRRQNINQAYRQIEVRVGSIVKKSSFYKTPPWGFDSSQDFINTVIAVETPFAPNKLFVELKQIEESMGKVFRNPDGPYTDRPIDLDILDFNNTPYKSDELTIPHDKMHLRSFVLYPLAEIAPNWEHPVLDTPVKLMLEGLSGEVDIAKIY